MSDPIRAAGGVVRRRADVLLVHRPKYGDWTLPKGKAKRAESDEECALREVEEETGLRCELVRELRTTRYRTLAGPKVVRYWEMYPVGGEFRPSREVDEVQWLSVNEARALLSYRRDAEVLDSLEASPLLVIRHASAGDRADWEGDDSLRPLDNRGKRQAQGLVGLLDPYEIHRIVSSPYRRCVQTVEPLAAARGLEVEETDELAEEVGADRARRFLLSLGGAAVACAHGSELEPLFGATRKGATWVLGRGAEPLTMLPSS